MTEGGPPPKPWERAGGSSGPTPFNRPSVGSTSDVVEASGTAKPGETVWADEKNPAVNTNAVGRPRPSRPREQNNGTNTYRGYGTGTHGASYGGGYRGLNSGGMYGNSTYRGRYGSSGLYGSSGMYGGAGGMYGAGGMRGPIGGYRMGMGGPGQDPNNPYGAPSAPPGFWMSFLRVMHGVVNCFGRISILVDQNTQAVHMFMSALLQLFDRGGGVICRISSICVEDVGHQNKATKTGTSGSETRTTLPPDESTKGPSRQLLGQCVGK